MIEEQCGTYAEYGDYSNWDAVYIGAEADGLGNWRWNDGTAWDFIPAFNDGLAGTEATKIAFAPNGEWKDWGKGGSKHGVACASKP